VLDYFGWTWQGIVVTVFRLAVVNAIAVSRKHTGPPPSPNTVWWGGVWMALLIGISIGENRLWWALLFTIAAVGDALWDARRKNRRQAV
jgi:hypothetical protein